MNDLAELLAEHVIDPDPTTPYQCACGFLLEFDYNRDTHRAHVAQMVLESNWLRDAKAETLREAAEQIEKEAHEAKEKVPERYFSGLLDAAAYLRRADNTTDRT